MAQHWQKIYLVTVFMALSALLLSESHWRQLGYRATVFDDKNLWSVQRHRVDDNPRTLAVLGASRIQLGFSPEVFHSLYPGWTLANLTVNAHYPAAALADLAENTEFRGVALVALDGRSLIQAFQGMQQPWVDYYQRDFGPGLWLHSQLAATRQSRLVTSNPDLALTRRLAAWLGHEGKPHITYLVFDRSRFGQADYQQIDADYHLRYRVRETREFFAGYPVPAPGEWLAGTRELMHWIELIEQRGGTVVLLRMPISAELWEVDEQFLPRRDYWDPLTRQQGIHSLHFMDSPRLAAYPLPDGSHLDFRDREAFTLDLLSELQQRGFLPDTAAP